MATATFIRYAKQSAGALVGVAKYVSQDKKTISDGQQLVSGQNCLPQMAAQELLATRKMHRKDSPVYFYHYVQSFHPDEPVTGKLAHEIAKEFAEKAWPESEVLIATHVDAAHIHSHFIVNAVCFDSGKMLRQGPGTLAKLRPISDEICQAHGLSVLTPTQKKNESPGMTTREYRSAAKGESWKFRLMNAIDDCMKYAASREDFISLMQSEGFEVKWTDTRKNITYTTSEGKKCCDDKLHDNKYLKEKMIYEFDIRQAALAGGAEAEERTGFEYSAERGAAGYAQRTQLAGAHGCDTAERRADAAAAGGAEKAADSGGHGALSGDYEKQFSEPVEQSCGECNEVLPTGWERQREYFLSGKQADAEYGLGADEDYGQYRFGAEGYFENHQQYAAGAYEQCKAANAEAAGSLGRLCDIADSVLQLASVFENVSEAPVYDSTTMRHRIDRKAWLERRRLKIAHGQNPDDHSGDDFEMRM